LIEPNEPAAESVEQLGEVVGAERQLADAFDATCLLGAGVAAAGGPFSFGLFRDQVPSSRMPRPSKVAVPSAVRVTRWSAPTPPLNVPLVRSSVTPVVCSGSVSS
jgi:hypothetical protein